MAARTRRGISSLSEEWRKKISAGVIMERLLSHIDGKLDMSSTQVKAADILLRKIVPDLARTEMTGNDGQPIQITVATGVPSVFTGLPVKPLVSDNN